MQNNLATLLAQERKLARGLEKESRAGLLPNVSAAAYQANLTLNLAALGFQPGTFPGIKTFIGPFNNFDARVPLQPRPNRDAVKPGRFGRIAAGLRRHLWNGGTTG